jgi:hypothetical protein
VYAARPAVVAIAAMLCATPGPAQGPEVGVGVVHPPLDPERPLFFAEAEVTGASSELTLRPLAVRGERLRVEALEGTEADRAAGWVRWRGDGVLLVSFSMLS